MKVFRKMFAFAVTVAAIAMATSAFAATAEYDASNVLVKVADTSALTETAQMTVAVVPANFGESSTAADIYYINQDEAATIKSMLASGLAVKEAITVPANYEVRVAGTNMDMTTINFATVQEPEDEEYEIIGENLTAATAVGIKGTFSLTAGVSTVYVSLNDSVAGKQGVIEWDLSDIVTNADITFGLEIQSKTPMDLSGISITGVSDADPRV